jgi:hypothetical protein
MLVAFIYMSRRNCESGGMEVLNVYSYFMNLTFA